MMTFKLRQASILYTPAASRPLCETVISMHIFMNFQCILRRCGSLFFPFLLICWSANTFSQQTLKIAGTANDQGYKADLLKLVLAALDEPYELQYLGKSVNRKRQEVLLEQGTIDLAWFPASAELDNRFVCLRFPIYKGLASYRFLLVKNEHRNRLQGVKTIDALKNQYVGGAGHFWSSTKIYEQHAFRLITAVKKPGLFHMLEGGRFDYFIRGANEVKKELELYSDLNLTIDPNVMVYMPATSYTYVNPKRPDLETALSAGFRRIINSGEYDAFVKKSVIYKGLISIISKQNRRILRLNSDSYEHPENNPVLWIDLENLATPKQHDPM